jgi:hypothetical protein
MANNRLPSTQILDSGGSGDPQFQVTQTTGGDWSRIRMNNDRSEGFWDIASSPENATLSFFASFTSHNVLSLQPHIVSIDGSVHMTGGTVSVADSIVCNGDISCRTLTAQQKNFVESHPTDPTKEIVYVSLEGPEAGVYERGTARLIDGRATIRLPEHFALVASEEGLTVQLTPRGQWLQLYTERLNTAQCVVGEAHGNSGEFDYLIQAVRKGREDHEVIRTRSRPDTASASKARL